MTETIIRHIVRDILLEIFEGKKSGKPGPDPDAKSIQKLKGDAKKGRKSKMMKKEIDKCNSDNPPKSCYDEWDTDKAYKKESVLREAIRQMILENKKKKPGPKKKKKPGPKPKKKSKAKKKTKTKGKSISTSNLSKSTVKKITNIANKRGYTVGSMKKEYVLGLRAWLAGHPPGVPQHAWATARIKKATPSKSWSVVKKSKAKKK